MYLLNAILIFSYFGFLFTMRIERKCFSNEKPIGLYLGYAYAVVFSSKGHEIHLECRRCNGSYPPPNASVSWASISLKNGILIPKVQVFKKKYKKYMQITDNYTMFISKAKSQHTGLISCNITMGGSNNSTYSELVNYFLEVINSEDEYREGTTSDWIQYRDDILQPIDYKLTEEGLENQDAYLEVFWTYWGPCLCGLHQFDSRKVRYAYPLIRVSESDTHSPVFPTWSEKFKKLYPFFASISKNATIFKQYNRCVDGCEPDILREDVDFRYSDEVYIKEESSAEFRCPNITKNSEVIWVFNDEVLLNKTVHALGTAEDEIHISVDTENTLHITKIQRKDSGSYSCFVDGIPITDIQVSVIEKFVLFTEDGQAAMRTIGIILLGCFIIWIVILILQGCYILLTTTNKKEMD